MKKILGILVLGFLWFGTANALTLVTPTGEDYDICDWVVNDAYQDHLNNYPNEDHHFFVVRGVDGKCEYGHGRNKELGLSECEKNRKLKEINGICMLFAIGKTRILKIKMKNPALEPMKEYVSYLDPGFVLSKDQHKLTYKNKKDNIQGRFLYDQEDVSDDYQVHVIYVLASDSKDLEYDVKGKIEKIVFKGNRHFEKRTGKKIRFDMTKEGKLDVSFLRVDHTKKEIKEFPRDPIAYFGAQIIKNGFYHPKKVYSTFSQENWWNKDLGRNQEGVMTTIPFTTPTGLINYPMATNYLRADPKSLWFTSTHEIIHILGFIQVCAPNQKYTHLTFRNDYMSLNDSGNRYIDKKKNNYFGHSNADCPLDLKKSVFLEPKEKDSQLIPYTASCEFDWNDKHINHKQNLNCLNRLNF